MATDSRKATVNFTNRQRILRDNFNIEIDWGGEIPAIHRDSFSLVLPDELPSSTRIFLDANNKMNYQFFDLGTKSELSLPEDLELGNIGHNPVTFVFRAVDPTTPGLLSARSAPLLIKTPKDKKLRRKQESFSLLQFAPRDMKHGVPMRVEFPRISGSSDPITIAVNRKECLELYDSLIENEDAIHALVLPSHIESIAERLASDALRGIFTPSERLSKKSTWQSHWNHLFSTWTGKGLSDFDPMDPNEVSDWIEDILSIWSTKFGNPARVISRHLGGVRR